MGLWLRACFTSSTDLSRSASLRGRGAFTGLIGETELGRLRDWLMGQLATAFAPQADLATLAHEARVIAAMAGILGLEDLTAARRALEAAMTAGTGVPEAVSGSRCAAAAARNCCAAA